MFKRKLPTEYTKTGKSKKTKWERGYRAPRPEDNNIAAIETALAEKMPEWEALDLVPNELLPMDTESWTHGNTPAQYDATNFLALFSPRQLLCHGTSVEIFRELAKEETARTGGLSDLERAALGCVAIAIDTLLNYNSRSCRWDSTILRVRSVFDRHDFAFKVSYAEVPAIVSGVGYDWAFEKTSEVVGFYWTDWAPDIVNPGREEQGSASL